tara:strand:- start:431 stop:949 length:519 start_codon:yes stop_codon:yes gene_type:complete
MATQKSYAERMADIKKHRAEMAKKRAAHKKAKAAKKVAKQKAKNVKKISKMAIKAEKKEKGAGLKSVTLGKGSRPEKLSPTGKIRRGAKGVEVTEGGAYSKYGKKSGAAKSFRSAFAKASKEGKKTFKWDGRSYTTEKKQAGGSVDKYEGGGKVEGGGLFDWPVRDSSDHNK